MSWSRRRAARRPAARRPAGGHAESCRPWPGGGSGLRAARRAEGGGGWVGGHGWVGHLVAQCGDQCESKPSDRMAKTDRSPQLQARERARHTKPPRFVCGCMSQLPHPCSGRYWHTPVRQSTAASQAFCSSVGSCPRTAADIAVGRLTVQSDSWPGGCFHIYALTGSCLDAPRWTAGARREGVSVCAEVGGATARAGTRADCPQAREAAERSAARAHRQEGGRAGPSGWRTIRRRERIG